MSACTSSSESGKLRYFELPNNFGIMRSRNDGLQRLVEIT